MIVDTMKLFALRENALTILEHFGSVDGEHHKAWVIDQVARALTGEGYDAWVKLNFGDDWKMGIAP
jgi:hypothetical protein